MADRFSSFAALAEVYKKNVDYSIYARPVDGSRLLVIAPHGGGIEPGTSELTKAIAGSEHSLYLFEGLMQSHNKHLHITSHNFDETCALKMVSDCDVAIGIHGRCDRDDETGVYLGGLDEEFKECLDQSIRDAGFETKMDGHDFPAEKKLNICNRGLSEKGAQIEIPKTLRDEFLKDEGQLERFANSIRQAIATYLN